MAYLTRLGHGLVTDATTLMQDGDLLQFTLVESDLRRAEAALAAPPHHD